MTPSPTPAEHTALPKQISQSFLLSTSAPKRKTSLIDKATGVEFAILKSPVKNAKIFDEIVRRYNGHDAAVNERAGLLERVAKLQAEREATRAAIMGVLERAIGRYVSAEDMHILEHLAGIYDALQPEQETAK